MNELNYFWETALFVKFNVLSSIIKSFFVGNQFSRRLEERALIVWSNNSVVQHGLRIRSKTSLWCVIEGPIIHLY